MNHPPVNTALLSYGMSGEVFHAPLLEAHPGFKLTHILERSSNRAVKRYPTVKTVRSLDEILQDKTIELVIVNTPHDTHHELATRVLEAGKHAVVEKPFVVSVKEGEALIRLARERGVMLSAFQNRRWDGDFMTVQKVLQSGILGPLAEFEAHYDRYRPEVDRTTWKEGARPGSGIVYNLGTHMIDQALTLFGKPESLSAHIYIQRQGGVSPDYYDIRLYYPGFTAILKSSYLIRDPGPRYVAFGVHGTFTKYGLDPQEEALKNGGIPGSPGWGTEAKEWWGRIDTQIGDLHVQGAIETLPGNYLGFYDSIYAALREGKSPEVTAEQALMVIRIVELAMESSEKGRRVTVP
ncbi:MAG: Gfo/Idh/MocA family oxidoreductase [Cyclobacteriaceae bacterium]|nr:Gfo/Idh/MocA family oxidoreductase [Cyclobacteriaceae bacterium]